MTLESNSIVLNKNQGGSMNTKAQIRTFKDAKGNTVSVEGLIPVFSRKRTEESKYWIIYSPHLNTIGYSNVGEKEALADFEKAFKIFFNVHFERGTIEKALLTFGWRKRDNELRLPKLGNIPAKKVGNIDLEKMAMAA